LNTKLCTYLKDALGDFLILLHQELLRSNTFEIEMFKKQDAVALFNIHLLMIADSLSTGGCPTSPGFRMKFQSEFRTINELRHFYQLRGIPLSGFIKYLQALKRSLHQLSKRLVIDEADRAHFWDVLTTQAEVIQTEIVVDWEKTNLDQEFRDLEKSNLQLGRERTTYKNIYTNTSNLVIITDTQGIIVEANPKAVTLFSNKDLVGQFCAAPLDRPEKELARFLSLFPPHQTHELPLQIGGSLYHFNLNIKPISDSLPETSGIILILSDVTCLVDHRQMLEQRIRERTMALSKSEKLLGALFHAVGKGIILLDADGEVVKANQQASEMYGIPLEVLVGSKFEVLTDAEGATTLRSARQKLFEGQRFNVEIISMYADGTQFPCQATMTRMDLDGAPLWPIILRDITELKSMQNKIIAEKEQVEEMNVTLRNVLKSIEDDRNQTEAKLKERILNSLLPGLEKVRNEENPSAREGYLSLLREQLVSLSAGCSVELDGDLLKLSKTELKICQFIKAGLSGKEICDTLNLSFETIQTHRKNIRRKLGLKGKNNSLHLYLAARNCDLNF
jgi:PAS domain S-box-containing protein